MSKKIWQARSDLRKSLLRLEAANKELKDTQTKLVHSAKMGQSWATCGGCGLMN